MPFEYNDDMKETGVDVQLDLPELENIPITSASFSEEAETSEVQFNNSYSQNIAVTGVTYSGSFEIAGRNSEVREKLWGASPENEESEGTSLPVHISAMSIIDGEGTSYTFTNVLVTSHSKDAPADDRTTSSYDFSAERLVIE